MLPPSKPSRPHLPGPSADKERSTQCPGTLRQYLRTRRPYAPSKRPRERNASDSQNLTGGITVGKAPLLTSRAHLNFRRVKLRLGTSNALLHFPKPRLRRQELPQLTPRRRK